MSKISLFYVLLIFSAVRLFSQKDESISEIENFGNNPGNLKMFMYDQSSEDTSKIPLVIVLHGCSQNAKEVAELTGWNKLAGLNHFLVMYPQQSFSNNPNLCFNWFYYHDIEKGKGECESIYQMINYAISNYHIDKNRIFITGLSAGAAMTVAMASTHPELFAFAAVFAGGAYKMAGNPLEGVSALLGNKKIKDKILVDNIKEQNPAYIGNYPAMIIYQGTDDPVVNYKNATILLNQWTGIHNCDTVPENTADSFMGIEDINRTEYSDTMGKTILIMYKIKNLGHRLMIKPGEKENEGGKTGVFGVNKGLHSTYQTALDFGIIKKK